MSSGGNTQVPALTSLRFFAAFGVLLFHSGGPALIATGRLPPAVNNLLANGYLGVTFFFILSGFVLATVYRGRLDTPGALRRYAVARVARVYPVYVLSIALMGSFVAVEGWSLVWQQFVLLQSWTTYKLVGAPANWNMQAWTLSVELLFYFAFPLLLRVLDRLSTAALAWALLPVCALITGFRLSGACGTENLLFPFMVAIPVPVLRLPEFVFGVLLGLLHLRGAVPAAPRLLRAAALGLLAVLAASSSQWVAPAASLLSGAIIVLTPRSLGAGPLGRALAHPAAVLLGAASYSFYLLAAPVYLLNQEAWGAAWPSVGRFLYVPILLAVSLATYRGFEEPLRVFLRERLRLRPPPVPAVP